MVRPAKYGPEGDSVLSQESLYDVQKDEVSRSPNARAPRRTHPRKQPQQAQARRVFVVAVALPHATGPHHRGSVRRDYSQGGYPAEELLQHAAHTTSFVGEVVPPPDHTLRLYPDSTRASARPLLSVRAPSCNRPAQARG